jgi:hypothetical protein
MNGNGIFAERVTSHNLPNPSVRRVFLLLISICFVMARQGWAQYYEGSPEVVAPVRKEQGPAHGSDVKVVLKGDVILKGELMAVEPDQIWLSSHSDSLVALPFDEVRKIVIHPFGFTAGTIVAWVGVAGLVTTAGMVGACASVDGSDCGAFALVWVGAWVTIGTISGLLIRPSRKIWPSKSDLRAYARFPQGLPREFLQTYPAHMPPQVEDPHVVPTAP